MSETTPPGASQDAGKAKPKTSLLNEMGRFAVRSKRKGLQTSAPQINDAVYRPPPGVVGERNAPRLAHDQACEQDAASLFAWAGNNNVFAGTILEGVTFLGYPYLALLSQRSEFRQPVLILAEECTRKGITFRSSGDADLSDRIIELTDLANNKFKIMDVLRKAMEIDGIFGQSFIYPDLARNNLPVSEDREELKTPLNFDKAKVGRNSLRGFVTVEPQWVSSALYNTTNPLSPDWYKPSMWWLNGKEVSASRMFQIVSNPLPDWLKPRYNFGGLSLTQMLIPYVDNWLETRQSVNDIIQAYTTWVLKTNMQAFLAGEGGGADVDARMQLFTLMKNNRGVFAIDKESEEFANVAAPLGGLNDLQAQAQEHMSSVTRIPLIKLFGIQPAGLNQSDENQLRVFYDTIHSLNERTLRPVLRSMIDLIQLSEFGRIYEDIQFSFNPLWELDEAGQADVAKVQADTDAVYLAAQVLDPSEVRERLGDDPKSVYSGIKGPPPEPDPMMMGQLEPNEKDNAESVTNAAAGGKTNGAANGV